jgi:putative endonuclease
VRTGPSRRELGSAGEEAAEAWYEERRYVVASRNRRCREDEIDLVLVKGPSVVFCEVMARTSEAFGAPAEAVTPAKQVRLRRFALRWLEDWAGARPRYIRFEAAAVLRGEVEVLEGAF